MCLTFSKVSIFSGLNQLNDITLDREFSAICGYREEEILDVFKEEIDQEQIVRLREWYNGYSFCGEKVYNPFDVLLYLSKRQFQPYWFETGTPEFLIKLIIEKNFYVPQLEELVASDELIGSFDIDFIEPQNLLFQTGYLTIKECRQSLEGMIYYLSYPNKEVKISLNKHLLYYLTKSVKSTELRIKLEEVFGTADLEKFKTVLQSLFASIPHSWYRSNEIANYEGYYCAVVYCFLAASGLTLIPEDTSNTGVADLTVVYRDKVYVIEFKVVDDGQKRGDALRQIEEKKYYQKYQGRYTDIYLVGVEFESSKRNIESFEFKKV